jgi:hypothetical protein
MGLSICRSIAEAAWRSTLGNTEQTPRRALLRDAASEEKSLEKLESSEA